MKERPEIELTLFRNGAWKRVVGGLDTTRFVGNDGHICVVFSDMDYGEGEVEYMVSISPALLSLLTMKMEKANGTAT